MSFRYYRVVFIISIWVILLPFLGMSRVWEIVMTVVPGVVLLIVAITLAQDFARNNKRTTDYAHKDSIDMSPDEPETYNDSDDIETSDDQPEHDDPYTTNNYNKYE